jgi:hypothetical protein
VSARLWLRDLPSTDPVFAPLQQAAHMLLESVDADWPVLERAHRRAVDEAAWGADLDAMEAQANGLRAKASRLREEDQRQGGANVLAVHAAELEALGYALGLTAARVAIRAHELAQAGTGVAA